ncbi:MAG: hypothetical protein ACJ8F1_00515 [Polyangia bacterium]
MSTLGKRGGDGVRSVRSVECLPDVEILSFEGSTRTFSYYNDVYAIAILFSADGDVTFRGRTPVCKSRPGRPWSCRPGS